MNMEINGSHESAKGCALMAVDELLEAGPYFTTIKDALGFKSAPNKSVEYWNEVKKELIKL